MVNSMSLYRHTQTFSCTWGLTVFMTTPGALYSRVRTWRKRRITSWKLSRGTVIVTLSSVMPTQQGTIGTLTKKRRRRGHWLPPSLCSLHWSRRYVRSSASIHSSLRSSSSNPQRSRWMSTKYCALVEWWTAYIGKTRCQLETHLKDACIKGFML